MELSKGTLKSGIKMLIKTIDLVKNGQKFDLSPLNEFAGSLSKELSDPKIRGPYTPQKCSSSADYPVYHTIDVAIISILMASRIGMKGETLHDMALGALMHDIGKINTPEELRWKQDGADDYEEKIIAEHPTFGAHWISTLVVLPEPALNIIREHHEQFDGNGYPNKLPDQKIANESKIISICNYYAFLISSLPEKPAFDERKAMFSVINESGKKFSPKMVTFFLNSLAPVLLDGSLYKLSSLVLLNTKEIATVSKVDSAGDVSPEVTIVTDSSQKRLARPFTISLKKDQNRKIVKILKSN